MIKPSKTELITISPELIVSVEEVGGWLNLSPMMIGVNNDLLERLIKVSTEAIENYTWVSLRLKTFESYYELNNYSFNCVCIGNDRLLLNRSPILDIADISKIEYLANDTWNEFDRGAMTIDGLYENTTEKMELRDWASIYFRESVPYETRNNAYTIRVTYQVGYDPVEIDPVKKIPEIYKIAIYNIVAFHYTYRGDCSNNTECSIAGLPVPCSVKGLLGSKSIASTCLGIEGENALC